MVGRLQGGGLDMRAGPMNRPDQRFAASMTDAPLTLQVVAAPRGHGRRMTSRTLTVACIAGPHRCQNFRCWSM
jgi:hypothetical protein